MVQMFHNRKVPTFEYIMFRLTPHVSTYKKFSISVWFKRTDIYEGMQGLFSNGDCETDPSILITSNVNSMGVRLETDTHSIRVNNMPVSILSPVNNPP